MTIINLRNTAKCHSHLRTLTKAPAKFQKDPAKTTRGVAFTRDPVGPPGVLGIWGEWLFIFRELGSTGNYLRGAREQAHNFGDLRSLARKQIK